MCTPVERLEFTDPKYPAHLSIEIDQQRAVANMLSFSPSIYSTGGVVFARYQVYKNIISQGYRMKMKQVLIASLTLILCVPAIVAAGSDDPSAPVRQFIDAFNAGNTQAAFATYADGAVTIVDEFAPHIWTGTDSARRWADAYDQHAQATGVTDGKVTYGKPTRMEVDGEEAYVILPTNYLYKEHGTPLQEEGQMTVVLNREAGAWKIRSWTWSGVKPHAAK